MTFIYLCSLGGSEEAFIRIKKAFEYFNGESRNELVLMSGSIRKQLSGLGQ